MPDSIVKADNISSLNGRGVGFPDGNVSDPGIKFSSDLDTGFYRVGDNRIGISTGGSKVGEIGPGYGAFRGNVVQCQVVRYDIRTSVVTGSGINGVEISALRVSITPRFANSMILCMFQVFGEGGPSSASTHNFIMTVYKDAVVPSGSFSGFNREGGNAIWSGMAMALPYETNYDSTPHQSVYYYHDFPGSTNPITYAPGVKSTDGSSYTYFINRTAGSLGTSGYENGTSFSIAWEIAQ